MSPETITIVIVIIVAVLLDVALIYWMRRNRRLRNEVKPFLPDFTSFRARLGIRRKRLKTWEIFHPRLAPQASGRQSASEGGNSSSESAWLASPPPQAHMEPSGPLGSIGHWLEWGLIILAVSLFCVGFLDLFAATRLPGNESEVFQSLDWTLVNSLRNYGQFPLWNPYIRTGIPYIADPMLHVYNPVVTLPVLLLGVRAGFKLAVFFSFLIAALGMWCLGCELGMKAPARIWVALMVAFAGQPLAHFFQGQYLFVFGFAWIPWIVAGLFLVVRTRRRRYAALTVLALGLLFFSGNTYYAFYLLLIAVIFGLVMLPRFLPRRPFVRIDGQLLAIFAVMATLALGVVAIQLLPEAQFWPWIRKDMKVAGSHTLGQIFLDYTSKDPSRPDAYSQLPAREEFYAYIGLSPFLALALLPMAWLRRKRRPIIFLLLVLLLVLAWVTLDLMPWREVFLGLPILRQFRHLLRILALGSFALILLAGMGLDELWRVSVESIPGRRDAERSGVSKTFGMLGSTFVIVFMVVSLVDLYQTNAPITRSIGIHQPAYAVMNWLRQSDLSDYTVEHLPSNTWADATIAARLPYFDAWYHFADIRNADQQVNSRPVSAAPKYIVQASSEPAPAYSEMRLVHEQMDTRIYQDLRSLPLVFKVPKARLSQDAGTDPLSLEEVVPLQPDLFSSNRIEVSADAEPGDMLVVLVASYPDWSVRLDGGAVDLKKVGGYLAVDMLAGGHRYTFAYRSKAFLVGLLASLSSIGLTFFLLFSDLDLSRQSIRRSFDQIVSKIGQMRQEMGRVMEKLAGWLKPVVSGGEPISGLRMGSEPEPELPSDSSLRTAIRRWLSATSDLLEALTRGFSSQVIVWAAILGVYLITRLVGLTQFPIYFFTDEAAQTVLAGDLVRDHFKNYAGDFLPTYFENGGYYRLGVSVYAQVVPYLLFGKSIAATRGASVLITLLGVVAFGLILRKHFKLRFWWSGVLLFSLAPAWFLHSRTAFETAEAVSFFTLFIYFYLEYRAGRTSYLYLALLAGALTFYTYSPFQVIMALCGLLLLLVDWRYHWRNRATIGRGLLLAVVLTIPYLRFILARGQANLGTLASLDSIWVRPVPLSEKILDFVKEYLHGLSPAYWFIPQVKSLIRHEMKGYAYLPWPYLPLIGSGFLISFASFVRKRETGDERRVAAFRTAWICLLVIPVSAALVQVGITRLLAMVVPAVLFAAVGLDWLLTWIVRRWLPARVLALGLFIVLAGFNFWMLRDVLVNGPLWYSDYGMSGLQYGTSQVFPAVQQYLHDNPGVRAVISPTWANGTDLLARFMLPESLPVELGSITGYMDQHKPLDKNTVFVLPPDEYRAAVESGKFTGIQVFRTLYYPDGRPGFYFLKLRYVVDIDRILAAESEQRHQMQADEITLDGQVILVRHSPFDMGSIDSLFDQNNTSVTRTLDANPYVLELTFPEPRPISGLSAVIGSAELEITARLYAEPDGEPDQQMARFKGSVERPEISWDFDQPVETRILRLEFKDIHQTEPAHVHVWELKLR